MSCRVILSATQGNFQGFNLPGTKPSSPTKEGTLIEEDDNVESSGIKSSPVKKFLLG